VNFEDRYPHVAGHRGLGGSVKAAELMTPELPHLQRSVLAVIEAAGERGVTGDQIAKALGWDKYRVRPRTAELRKLGKIIDSRQRRPSDTGINSIVWALPCYSTPISMGTAA
jgi:transcription initiation factor IIE alpha subunit